MRFVVVVGIALLAWPAVAQQVLSPLSTKVVISGQDCQRLVRHVPAPDVAYKPGIDVHGKAVAPADLPGGGAGFKLPDHIEFNYTINPVNYGLTKSLAAQSSSLSGKMAGVNSSQAANQAATIAANQKLTQLQAAGTSLTAKGTTLSSQLSTAQSTLGPLQAQVTAGTLSATSPKYLDAKAAVATLQSQITANNTAIQSNNTQITTTQSQITSQTAAAAQLTQQQTQLQSQQAAVAAQQSGMAASGPGGGNTQMSVAAIRYDFGTGQLTIDGKPMDSGDQQGIAAECRRQGIN